MLLVIPLSFTSSKYLVIPPPGWSLQWYASFLTNPAWLRAAQQSIIIATVCMLVSTAVGTAAAFPLTRREFRGRKGLFILIASPVVVPEIVIAVSIYSLALTLGLTEQVLTVALGQSAIAMPFATLVVAASLRGFDREYEDAALSLGADRTRVLRYVTLPAIAPAIGSAMVFTFIFSFNDLVIPLFLGGVRLTPLSIRMWITVRSALDLTTLSVAVLWFALAMLVVLVAAVQQRRLRSRSRAARQRVSATSAMENV
jgi:putative spermidine/putrescine transport system permease protein